MDLSNKNLLNREAIFTPMIKYCIPIIIGALIQVLFNLADQVVLSYMAGTEAVAAVGACTHICSLAINLFCGLSGGVGVVLARFSGAKDEDNVKKTVNTSVISSLFIGIIATTVSLPFVSFFLTITKCPEECFSDAKIYLIIYLASLPAILVYNFGSTVIRIAGDSTTPLLFMLISGVINVGLNVGLCFVLEHKVAAVAIATLVSQCLGAIFVVLYLMKQTNMYKFEIKKPVANFNFEIMGKIMKYGLPNAISCSLFSISNIQIQRAINEYGAAAIAGVSASSTIEGLISSFNTGFGVTMLTFCGHNLGANQKKRVNLSIIYCLTTAVLTVFTISLSIFIYREQLLSLYLNYDMDAVSFGMVRMDYIGKFYAIAAANNCLASLIQAFGYSSATMVDGVVTILLFRIFWMAFIYPNHHTFNGLMLCYLVSWTLMLSTRIIMSLVLLYRYNKKGMLRKI